MKTYSIGGQLLDFSTPKIMGILNLTPDSFYDGGNYNDITEAIAKVVQMINEGADIIDVGAVSTRPGAAKISTDEEISRILPVVKEIKLQFPDIILSIDTTNSAVVKKISEFTAFILNDISAFEFDAELPRIISQLQFPYIIMHMQGTPINMQETPEYEDVSFEVLQFLSQKAHKLRMAGVDQIIVDPGFGFGKTIQHNFEMLNKLNVFNILEYPILAGLSRKSMIYKALDIEPQQALNGTTALNMLALKNGASILRVHDVKEAVETRTLWHHLNSI